MKTVTLSVAYIPLVDAAPLIVAQEMGFAEAEGLSLDLIRAPSWSSVRDMLSFGRVDAAHILSPVPVAVSLGLGGAATPLSAVMVLSVNGSSICVNKTLATSMREAGFAFGFDYPFAAGKALAAASGGKPIRFGVPFPFSMHFELVRYWLDAVGAFQPDSITIRTIPPAMMSDALAAGDIDAFCVGEPWGSMAVENGFGEMLLPSTAIWKRAPEKVLAVRTDWAETEPHLLGRLMRAVWSAARWLGDPESLITAAEILSRRPYLDVPADIIDRSLGGVMTISDKGEQRRVPAFIDFFNGAANFPWRSQAAWIGERLARRASLDPAFAAQNARQAFRSDLYRSALKPLGALLPAASEKVEGAILERTPAAAETGRLFLEPDGFFDGQTYDPSAQHTEKQ
ncbi:MAG: ABC transporter substrate-binding protein [Hyphomicrobiaceae bacterium]|nr:ABC transporter substrate-binding protein [Hyphomicrobiaceae bacterium]